MNCKPGDLAIVVKTRGRPDAIGRIVRVVRPAQPGRLGPAWVIDPPLVLKRGSGDEVYDCALRPIRDPGDDAKDEMLRPLPNTLEVA